jgi:hypothetical protein
MEAFRSAAAHRRLIETFAIQAGIDHVSDLLDQLFKIAVV